jgi:predicted extracellular nuclease
VLISELLIGVPGNNNLEFIELYQAAATPADLTGYSLWFQLADDREPELVYEWTDPAGIAGFGHYLLARPEVDLGVIADAEFHTPLAPKGMLELRDAEGNVVDAVGWGDAPSTITDPLTVPANGESFTRLPDGDAGNGTNTGDNAADFTLREIYQPQNSGMASTPALPASTTITMIAPDVVSPGGSLDITLEVRNEGDADLENVAVVLPVPAGLEPAILPAGAEQDGNQIRWTIPTLAAGDSATVGLPFEAPFTYAVTRLGGHYTETPAGQRAYGAPQLLTVGGGSIPIAVARDLVGQTVTIEGVATMYTGGFFAGSDGVKFYMEDETGGIQVYIDGGMDVIDIDVGDRVQVTGDIELFRDSLEITPHPTPEDVVVLESGLAAPPVTLPLDEARQEEAYLGRLAAVVGEVRDISDNNFDYTLNLVDEAGNTLLVLVEKDTGFEIEPIIPGENYQVTGVLENYAGRWQLKPRRQADFEQLIAPELRLEVQAPLNVSPGEPITITYTATNYMPDPLSALTISTTIPAGALDAPLVLDDGTLQGEFLTWQRPELAPGASWTVRYTGLASGEDGGVIAIPAGSAVSAEEPEPVVTTPQVTFLGPGIPIWAIQGDGFNSPYIREEVTTDGIVTGIFPDLDGFWIQEPTTDDHPATSAGIFVLANNPDELVQPGDWVELSGRVREISGQTTLGISGPESVAILSVDNELPAPVELNPPADAAAALAYYEALEGMLVSVSDPALVVQPTSRFGEFALIRADSGQERVFRNENTGLLIFVDDGSDAAYQDGSELPLAVASGHTVSDLLGPLAYTFDQYKIEPVITPTVTTSGQEAFAALPPLAPGEFSIATYNVENFFDDVSPHPSSPDPPDADGYALKLAKTAAGIEALGFPTIVALQEVENIDILEDLAATDILAPYAYAAVLIEGSDSRGIDNGYLVRGDQATVEEVAAFPGPSNSFSRPPLLIMVTLNVDGDEQTLYVLNNHFLSLSAGEEATEAQRTAQAEVNAQIVAEILAGDPNALIAVTGDLNSFRDTPPLDTLEAAGLRHVYDFDPDTRLYTYIFEGQSETLDHILLSPALFDLVTRVDALHINADYPLALPDDTGPQRTSDHDPLIVVFSFD